jgi:MoaA/NifB/PqqE/SkfB family radical SAM enzyme
MQKKILFLGDNSKDTDHCVQAKAQQHHTINHGLVCDSDFVPTTPGFYHSSVADLPWGTLLTLADKFDEIHMLDQPQAQWSHWKCVLGTYKIMCYLEDQGKITEFRNNKNIAKLQFWQQYQKENSSFCIYPWIEHFERHGNLRVCARGNHPITKAADVKDWRTDPNFVDIRKKMLKGEQIPEHCGVCYDYEKKGIESYRQYETLEWMTKLDIENVNDLDKIDNPVYYEFHTSNKCNIKCRSCHPGFSDQIEKEFKKFDIVPLKDMPKGGVVNQASLDFMDISTLTPVNRVYFQGGEPTIMPEVLTFMRDCIKQNKTDFEFSLCTNGAVLTREFIDLSRHFTNMNISVSLDGFGKVNDYWRWGSKWEKVIENAHIIESLGHYVSINTVPGIYNVTNLHLLFEFLDREFASTAVYLQINFFPAQSAYNHPEHDLVLESMERCKQTSIYYSDAKSCKSGIDSLYNHYSNNPTCDLNALAEFFRYNDDLDRVRKSKLADYIPELEACRRFLKS